MEAAVTPVSFDEQRAFAKQILIRLWEKYGGNPDRMWTFECINAMAPIDLALASEWSAAAGHQYDSILHQTVAEKMAETDAQGVLKLLAEDRNPATQALFQKLAQRFLGRDRARSLLFADEAVARARALQENERPAALAAAGALLVRPRPREGGARTHRRGRHRRRTTGHPGFRGPVARLVAGILAPEDSNRAAALVNAIDVEDKDQFVAFVAQSDSHNRHQPRRAGSG